MLRISPPSGPAPEQIAAVLIASVAAIVLVYRFSPWGAASAHLPSLPPPPAVIVEADTRLVEPAEPPGAFTITRVELLPARDEPYVSALLNAVYEQLDNCPTLTWVDIHYKPLRGDDDPHPTPGTTRLTLDHRDMLETGHGAQRQLECQLVVRVDTADPAQRREWVFEHDARIDGAESPAAWYRASASAAAPVLIETLCPSMPPPEAPNHAR